ncbi:outer membrane porin [Escherichia coli]|nr:outer membrane porin [Escherichia coli]
MKLKIVAVVVTGLLAANVAHAAEVYNKDGNKLDLYGKVTALRYFTDDKRDDGDKTYARLGFKGETQINDQMIGLVTGNMILKAITIEANGSRGKNL